MAIPVQVVALVSNPLQFALRMKAEESSGWAKSQLEEVNLHIFHDPKLLKWTDQHQDSFVKWIIKWCIDLKHMSALIRNGSTIQLIFEDELRNDTDQTLTSLCKRLSLPYPASVKKRFSQHCVFQDAHGRQIPSENWRQLMSGAQYETALEVIRTMGIASIPGFEL